MHYKWPYNKTDDLIADHAIRTLLQPAGRDYNQSTYIFLRAVIIMVSAYNSERLQGKQ